MNPERESFGLGALNAQPTLFANENGSPSHQVCRGSVGRRSLLLQRTKAVSLLLQRTKAALSPEESLAGQTLPSPPSESEPTLNGTAAMTNGTPAARMNDAPNGAAESMNGTANGPSSPSATQIRRPNTRASLMNGKASGPAPPSGNQGRRVSSAKLKDMIDKAKSAKSERKTKTQGQS